MLILLACVLVIIQPRLNAWLAGGAGGKPAGRAAQPGAGRRGSLVSGGLRRLLRRCPGRAGHWPARQLPGRRPAARQRRQERARRDRERHGRRWCSSSSRTSTGLSCGLIAVGSTAGGLLGAQAGTRLPPLALRIIIVIIGVISAVKLIFFYRPGRGDPSPMGPRLARPHLHRPDSRDPGLERRLPCGGRAAHHRPVGHPERAAVPGADHAGEPSALVSSRPWCSGPPRCAHWSVKHADPARRPGPRPVSGTPSRRDTARPCGRSLTLHRLCQPSGARWVTGSAWLAPAPIGNARCRPRNPPAVRPPASPLRGQRPAAGGPARSSWPAATRRTGPTRTPRTRRAPGLPAAVRGAARTSRPSPSRRSAPRRPGRAR